MFAGFNPDAWWEMPAPKDANGEQDVVPPVQEESSTYGSLNSDPLDIESGQGSA